MIPELKITDVDGNVPHPKKQQSYKPTSQYVLLRRANPNLRDENDLKKLAKAEAKRQRRAQRKENAK